MAPEVPVEEFETCIGWERESVALWLLEAERELRKAQRAVEQGRPHAKARLATARSDHALASSAAELLLTFPSPGLGCCA